MVRASPWSVPASCRSDAKGEAKRNPLRGVRTDGPSSNRANGWQFDRAKGTDQVPVVRVQRRQEEIRDDGKTALDPQTADVRGFEAPKANADSVGGDKERIEGFETNSNYNLYRSCNRMSPGSIVPAAIKAVAVPKKIGGNTFSASRLSATFPALGFSSSEFRFRLIFPLALKIIEARGLTQTKLN
jgi:hypothetical protein